MRMPVVNVREMRVLVGHGNMFVPVLVWLAGIDITIMRVLMVHVM